MSYPWEKDYCYRVGENLLAKEGGLQDPKRRGYVFQLVRSTINLAERVGVKSFNFSSIGEMERFHRIVIKTRTMKSLMTKRESLGNLSPSPFVGTEFIQPIVTSVDHFRECLELYCCDPINAGDVIDVEMMKGEYLYIYRVFEPVRAALSIISMYPGWEMISLVGPGQTDFPKEIAEQVYQSLTSSPKVMDLEPALKYRGQKRKKEDQKSLFSLMDSDIVDSAKMLHADPKAYLKELEVRDEARN